MAGAYSEMRIYRVKSNTRAECEEPGSRRNLYGTRLPGKPVQLNRRSLRDRHFLATFQRHQTTRSRDTLRRNPLLRAASFALLLLFNVVAVGREASHALCPVHDGVGSGIVAPAAHSAHGTAVPDDGPASHESGAHGCNCLGTCSPGPGVLPAFAFRVEQLALSSASVRPARAETAIPVAARSYLLPFATAPPA
jgi:hypothetical protein